MRKRILFKEVGTTVKVLSKEQTGEEGDVKTNAEAENLLDAADFRLRFQGENLPGYEASVPSEVKDASGNSHTKMGGFPSRELNFAVPAEDTARVNGWVTGDYHGANPESEKLMKNYQSAVNELLTGYFYTANNHNLFTSPCRLAWCAVYNDGERGRLRELTISLPNIEAPKLPIISMALRDGRFYSNVEIRNVPSALEYYMAFPEDMNLESLGISRIEVYATAQVSVRDPKSEVYGIRGINVDGELRRCWEFDRYSADEIGISCAEDTLYRQISSMESGNLNVFELNSNLFEENSNWQKIPISSGKLTYFNQAKVYKAGYDEKPSTGTPEVPSETEKRVLVSTGVICLGEPERDKHLRGVAMYGIFPRMDSGLRFRVYGSHHRENWRLISESHTPYILGLRAAPFRWFKVEVETLLRPGDLLDALTFEYS